MRRALQGGVQIQIAIRIKIFSKIKRKNWQIRFSDCWKTYELVDTVFGIAEVKHTDSYFVENSGKMTRGAPKTAQYFVARAVSIYVAPGRNRTYISEPARLTL